MAGHSKWANIQYRKKAQDAKRSRLFTILIREISGAARVGGSDLSANPRLRLAVDKALSANMAKDVIERALKRGAGELQGQSYEAIRYEGFASNGVAVLVDCLSDNRNRAVAEVRHAFSRYGGRLGQAGSVAHLFKQRGILSYAKQTNEEALLEAAIECQAEDLLSREDDIQIMCAPEDLFAVKDSLAKKDFIADDASVEEVADTLVTLEPEQAEKVFSLLVMLSDLDDVQAVYSNADLSDYRPSMAK